MLETMQIWLPLVLQHERKVEPYRLRPCFVRSLQQLAATVRLDHVNEEPKDEVGVQQPIVQVPSLAPHLACDLAHMILHRFSRLFSGLWIHVPAERRTVRVNEGGPDLAEHLADVISHWRAAWDSKRPQREFAR